MQTPEARNKIAFRIHIIRCIRYACAVKGHEIVGIRRMSNMAIFVCSFDLSMLIDDLDGWIERVVASNQLKL